jgi:hypothetical protein
MPLVDRQETADDNLYGWLDVMFAFCTGKPFAYYSRYVPSPQVYRIAWRYKVQLVHFPLRLLPSRLLARNKSFRFMCLTRNQAEEFERRRTEAAGMWSPRHPISQVGASEITWLTEY